jgi:hypothetical protein
MRQPVQTFFYTLRGHSNNTRHFFETPCDILKKKVCSEQEFLLSYKLITLKSVDNTLATRASVRSSG